MPWGVSLTLDYGDRYEPTAKLATPAVREIIRNHAKVPHLLAVAEKVGELVEADLYRVYDVTTGSGLPKVWLPAGGPEAAAAIEALRGCLSVDARPKDEDNRQAMAPHRLLIFVGEAAHAAAAEVLALAAQQEPDSNIAELGLAVGPAFIICVARSVVQGVPPMEDAASLERLRAPLSAALGAASA